MAVASLPVAARMHMHTTMALLHGMAAHDAPHTLVLESAATGMRLQHLLPAPVVPFEAPQQRWVVAATQAIMRVAAATSARLARLPRQTARTMEWMRRASPQTVRCAPVRTVCPFYHIDHYASNHPISSLSTIAADIVELIFGLRDQHLIEDFSCAVSESMLLHGRMVRTVRYTWPSGSRSE